MQLPRRKLTPATSSSTLSSPRRVTNDIALGLNSTILYPPVSSPDDHRHLQEDLLTLSCWADTWCMEFNTGKCYVLHIQTKSQKKDNVSIPYTMNEVELKRVSDTAYLGVNINEHLS